MKGEESVAPRERARQMYLRSGKKKSLPMIAEELNIPLATVKTWKRRDGWDTDSDSKTDSKRIQKKVNPDSKVNPKVNPRKPKKKGGQQGNQNGIENSGGAPQGNQNAVTTGEYARLLFSDLLPEEQALMAAVPPDSTDIMRQDLGLLCVRERRMLGRIAALQAGTQTNAALDKIQNIEEGLTRLRREKQRIINALHEFSPKDPDDDGSSITIVYDYGDEESGAADE